jgi:hypothetical protein
LSDEIRPVKTVSPFSNKKQTTNETIEVLTNAKPTKVAKSDRKKEIGPEKVGHFQVKSRTSVE